MEYKKLLKCGIVLLLCFTFIMSAFHIRGISAIFDPVIPIEDDGTDWGEKTAIYWNPKRNIATNSNASRPVDIATDSNASRHAGKATNSNVIKTTNFATHSNSDRNFSLVSGSNATDGLTPDTAVENLNIAIRQAEKLSRQLRIEMSDIVIYAMNPMHILQETSYTVNGKGVTIVPWGEGYDEDYIFIVEGGQLTLDNIRIQPHNVVSEPKESSLVYMSSGVIQLGEQVESYGTFVLDYTQSMSTQEPLIVLKRNFDFATHYRLDLRFPKGMEQDVTVINSLSPDKIPADVFIDAFPVVDIEDEWKLFVEEQSHRVRRDTVNVDNILSNTSKLTQKSLVARREEKINRKAPDLTNPKNLTISKTVVGTQEDKEKYFEFLIRIVPPDNNLNRKYKAYVLDTSNKVVEDSPNYNNRFDYIEVGGNDVVLLKDGQKLVFTNIPLDSRYNVIELINTNYKQSVKVVTGGIEMSVPEPDNLIYFWTGSQTIVKNGNSVEFTNTNRSLVTITVSKQVVGDYANRTKQFSFKIFLRDNNRTALADGTQFSYTGSVIAGSGAKKPKDGILTLNQEGSTTFELMHGQQIEITGVPPGQVRIHEKEEKPEYNTSYRDGNSAPIDRSDTEWVELVSHKTFDFTNTRIEVVPSGVLIGKDSGVYLLILSMLMLVGMISAAHIYNHRKRR